MGVPREFIIDGVLLLKQLSGEPGAGASDCLRDAPRDLVRTEAFLGRWVSFRGTRGYDEVLEAAERIAQALTRFNDTINELTSAQHLVVQGTAVTAHGITRILRNIPASVSIAGILGVVGSVVYAGEISGPLVLSLLPLVIVPIGWWPAGRLYGEAFPRAMRASAAAAWRSRTRFYVLGGLLLLLAPLLPEPLRLATLWSVLIGSTTISWVFRPPAVIVLASSLGGREARRLMLDLMLGGAARGHRVIYFLRKEARGTIPFEESMMDGMDNLHLRTDTNWEECVFPLLDLVPVIVVDARKLSEGLLHELDRINESPSLAAKTFVFMANASRVSLTELSRLSSRVVHEDDVAGTVASAVTAAMRTGAIRHLIVPPAE